jgi:hypothetical protein
MFVLCIVLSFSCKDNPTESDKTLPTRALSLGANTTTGTTPCDVILTGTFNAYTDTTKMYVPDMFVVGAQGRIVIPYALTGTTSIPAKRIYVDTLGFTQAGTYSIYMALSTTTQMIYSDTLAITIH